MFVADKKKKIHGDVRTLEELNMVFEKGIDHNLHGVVAYTMHRDISLNKLDKKIIKFMKRHCEAVKNDENTTHVMTLKKKHFKSELSNPKGFGFQDLKEKPKAFVTKLITQGFDLSFNPVSTDDRMTVTITAKTKK